MQKERIEEVMKALQEQMIKGGSNPESAEAKKYKQLKQKVKKQRAEQEKLIADKKRQEEQMYEMEKNYVSLQEQVDEYKKIIL